MSDQRYAELAEHELAERGSCRMRLTMQLTERCRAGQESFHMPYYIVVVQRENSCQGQGEMYTGHQSTTEVFHMF